MYLLIQSKFLIDNTKKKNTTLDYKSQMKYLNKFKSVYVLKCIMQGK